MREWGREQEGLRDLQGGSGEKKKGVSIAGPKVVDKRKSTKRRFQVKKNFSKLKVLKDKGVSSLLDEWSFGVSVVSSKARFTLADSCR
ncbi:hypothetical protein AVEN_223416-1 [Araneus ventricosus]|uniref:Uncharacterized protein n=1 Tax=Araneus ventricosus TaxID=182803 RepID=A0A4Y2TS79_ARAVE|nr:hypothetical protein AVEN_223416-1 [Araneus ventricosus]